MTKVADDCIRSPAKKFNGVSCKNSIPVSTYRNRQKTVWTVFSNGSQYGRWIEIDNNRAKRSIKLFVSGMKNRLYVDIPSGAKESAENFKL